MPRGRAPRPRLVDIGSAFDLLPQTVRNQGKAIDEFDDWLFSAGSSASLEQLVKAPTLFSNLARAFGAHLFRKSYPLYVYLMFLTGVQRTDPSLRPSLHLALELAKKWRALDPSGHCVPVAYRLFGAIAALAIMRKWHRFAGIAIIALGGPTRIGEALRALRSDLVLPCDLLDDIGRTYLQERAPKSDSAP